MKKKIIIVGAVFIFLIVTTVISFVSTKKEAPSPSSQISPTTTIAMPPISNFTPEQLEEKKLETNYANDKEKTLKDKPWLLKLPLKSTNYFISYSPETDEILVSLYYSTVSNISKTEQLSLAKTIG